MLYFTLLSYLSDGPESVDSARRFVPMTFPVLFRLSHLFLIMEVQIIYKGLKRMKPSEGIKSVLITFRNNWQWHPRSAEHGRLELCVHFLQVGWSETPYRDVQIYQLELCRNGL